MITSLIEYLNISPQIITISVMLGVFALLTLTRYSIDLVLVAGLSALILSGVVNPKQAFSGFANPGILTVAVLYTVATGIRQTGAVNMLCDKLLSNNQSSIAANQARIAVPVAGFSALMNNTPIVAMFIPGIIDWSRRYQQTVSKYLLPLSYASILGGMCSLIGTSTNLVVNGMAIEQGIDSLQIFEPAWIGIPCVIIGIGWMLIASRWLLPDRRRTISRRDDPREYILEMEVEENSPLIGKTIEEAGLRHLPQIYLTEISRKGKTIPAVGPDEVLQAKDHLMFAGVVDSVLDIKSMRGLKPATDKTFDLNAPAKDRYLVEAVVSNTSPMIGFSIREGKFRSLYDAAVIAVSRNGERLKQRIGDIVLRPGDTLLVEGPGAFIDKQRNSRDFYLISPFQGYKQPQYEKVGIAAFILLAMVLLAATGLLSMLEASILAAAGMVGTRCINLSQARRSIDLQVIISLAAAFGIGQAMSVSGTADLIAGFMIQFAGQNPWLALVMVYITVAIFTEVITNNAAAVLVFPIAFATATSLNISPIPFIIAIMIGASASFASPIGYQTNLMVFGPGGYRFRDYILFGLPLTIIIGLFAVTLIPVIWPF